MTVFMPLSCCNICSPHPSTRALLILGSSSRPNAVTLAFSPPESLSVADSTISSISACTSLVPRILCRTDSASLRRPADTSHRGDSGKNLLWLLLVFVCFTGGGLAGGVWRESGAGRWAAGGGESGQQRGACPWDPEPDSFCCCCCKRCRFQRRQCGKMLKPILSCGRSGACYSRRRVQQATGASTPSSGLWHNRRSHGCRTQAGPRTYTLITAGGKLTRIQGS